MKYRIIFATHPVWNAPFQPGQEYAVHYGKAFDVDDFAADHGLLVADIDPQSILDLRAAESKLTCVTYLEVSFVVAVAFTHYRRLERSEPAPPLPAWRAVGDWQPLGRREFGILGVSIDACVAAVSPEPFPVWYTGGPVATGLVVVSLVAHADQSGSTNLQPELFHALLAHIS
jgi:hypothetical protein